MNFAQKIDLAVKPIANSINEIVFFKFSFFGAQFPIVVLWLVVAGLFFTIYFRFINLTGFKHAIKIIRGGTSAIKAPGEVTHFQALTTALSGTVGLGNIGGVALAITAGGAGALFWMILAGFLGMSSKFVECTLAVKFRKQNEDGTISGGPMYYLQQGFSQKGFPKVGSFLGKFYAVGIVLACLGIGNMYQSNQAFEQMVSITGGKGSWLASQSFLFGLVFASILGVVIIGGLKRIVKVTEKVVPFMAVLYLTAGIIIILMNFEVLGKAIALVFSEAFTSKGITGGAIGAMIIGFKRAVFSNEAGLGSAAIAHSAVKTDKPITEGLVAILEPFIDTIVICTVTGLVIITTQIYDPMLGGVKGGIAMTSFSFARNISWFPYVLAVAALLFAFSTAISWSYYGLKGFTYLFGHNKKIDIGFKFVYCIFFLMGSMINVTSIINISDALVYVICIPNIIGMYMMAPYVKQELQNFLQEKS